MEQKLRHVFRIFAADIDGTKSIKHALNKVKGISFSMSNAICTISGVDASKKAGLLTEDEIKKIESTMVDLSKFPKWMLNRRKDYDEGTDKHLLGVNLKLRKEFDVKKLKKIKSYRGMRHAAGLPVRGQRTKGHFRKSKKSLGVKRKKK
ncbi:30S ribosomal protein S13 [archaeon]|nr:30S ribosomal protein S13 [archaeon]